MGLKSFGFHTYFLLKNILQILISIISFPFLSVKTNQSHIYGNIHLIQHSIELQIVSYKITYEPLWETLKKEIFRLMNYSNITMSFKE